MLKLRRILIAPVLLVACGAYGLAGCSSGDSTDTGTAVGDSDDTLDASVDEGVDDDTSAGGDDTDDLDAGVPTDMDGGYGPLPGGGFISIAPGDGGALNILCGNEVCACADGIDNDGDGVADGFDDECTGPFDNDEATFATGVPGDNRDPKWQDCFFDGNSGAGDDGCRYHTDCITGKADAESDPKKCGISEECINFCQPLVPPGCDCFGCCDVTVDGESLSILVGEACSTEVIDDEDKCPRCVPQPACQNECGECELCVGKTLEDLPAKCFDKPPPDGDPDPPDPNDPPPPPNTCDGNLVACSSNADCGSELYCGLGCCRVIVRAK